MWFTKIFTAVMVGLATLLPSSCSKTKSPSAHAQSPSAHSQPAATIPVASQSATNKNLGELSLTNHYETCVSLGAGKSCTIRPSLMSRDNLQLTMSVESKNTSGRTENLSVVQVVTKAGKPFEVAVGDMNLTLTPKLSAE
jgi:transglutaminase/protease-like cytokinesis protein 3